jgi:hypothetical protein
MIEHIRDGYEEPLPEKLHDEVLKETIIETKRQNKLQQKVRPAVASSTPPPPTPTKTTMNPSLRRADLLTRTHFAFTSAWRKKQPTVHPVGVGTNAGASDDPLGASVEHAPSSPPQPSQPMERDHSFEGTGGATSSSPSLLFPKLQRDQSMDSDIISLHSTNSPTPGGGSGGGRSSSIFLIAKLRKLSSRAAFGGRQSKIFFKSFSSNDPILAIRPLAEISYCCVVHQGWFMSWKRFIQSGLFEDIEYPMATPGPITNHLLLRKPSKTMAVTTPPFTVDTGRGEDNSEIVLNHQLRRELHLNQDYLIISPNVWKTLFRIYGGGPPIFREETNIYSPEYDANGQPWRRRGQKNNS